MHEIYHLTGGGATLELVLEGGLIGARSPKLDSGPRAQSKWRTPAVVHRPRLGTSAHLEAYPRYLVSTKYLDKLQRACRTT